MNTKMNGLKNRRRRNIVNTLTVSRAPLVAAAILFALVNNWFPNWIFVFCMLLFMSASAITDLFDGKFARAWNVTSRFGALADPLMDKIFYVVTIPVAVFIAFWNGQIVHAAVLLGLDVVSMLRDQWVSFLRSLGTMYGGDVRANWSGKLRTAAGFPIIVVLYLYFAVLPFLGKIKPEPIAMPEEITWFMIFLETSLLIVTLISAVNYTMHYRPYIRRAMWDASSAKQAESEDEKEESVEDEEHMRLALTNLRTRLASLGRVVASVAHDFNNLLTVIQTGVDTQAARPGGKASELQAISQAARQAGSLIRQLQVYAGLSELKFTSFDLNAAIAERWPMLRTQVPSHIELELDQKPMLPNIFADVSQVVQIVSNLLTNAAEAIGAVPGVIRIETSMIEASEIKPGEFSSNHPLKAKRFVKLSVSDTGCGVDNVVVSDMLKPFFSTKGDDRGLGLATVANVLESHGGAISIHAAPGGKGAVFSVLLPVARDSQEKKSAGKPENAAGAGVENKKSARPFLLLVDDDQRVRTATKLFLNSLDCEVVEADGADAVSKVPSHLVRNVNIALVDANVNNGDGIHALATVRKLFPGIPVFLMSGHSEHYIRQTFHDQKFDGYIAKPFTSPVLKAMLEKRRR